MHFAEVTADIITLCQQYLLFFFIRLQSDRYHYPKATGVLVGCKLVQCLVKIVESYRGRELPTSEYIVGDVQYKPGPLRLAAWHYWYLTWGQYAVPGSRLKLKAYLQHVGGRSIHQGIALTLSLMGGWMLVANMSSVLVMMRLAFPVMTSLSSIPCSG